MTRPRFLLRTGLPAALLAVFLSGCAVAVPAPPTDVTQTGVTLNGYVQTNTGGEVTYWFRFGGRDLAHRTVTLARGERRLVSVRIDDLSPVTEYGWGLCAEDGQKQPTGAFCSATETVRTADDAACGQVLTHDLTLDGDITCSGPVGLRMGADNVTLDLNGHTVKVIDLRESAPGLEQFAVVDTRGHHGTTVRNGTVWYCCASRGIGREGGSAVLLSGSHNLLQGLEISGELQVSGDHNRIVDTSTFDWNRAALNVTGNHNTVLRGTMFLVNGGHAGAISGSRNRLVDSTASADQGGGVRIGGDHNTAKNFRFNGFLEEALLVTGHRDRVVDSQIRAFQSDHALIFRGATDSSVRRSTVTAATFGAGVEVGASSGTRLVGNTVVINPPPPAPPLDGIQVAADSAGTLLRLNTVTGASDDGIDADSATTRLDRNRADSNGDFGIEAVPGVTDLGGNLASGNGNPLQCQNVFCLPG